MPIWRLFIFILSKWWHYMKKLSYYWLLCAVWGHVHSRCSCQLCDGANHPHTAARCVYSGISYKLTLYGKSPPFLVCVCVCVCVCQTQRLFVCWFWISLSVEWNKGSGPSTRYVPYRMSTSPLWLSLGIAVYCQWYPPCISFSLPLCFMAPLS